MFSKLFIIITQEVHFSCVAKCKSMQQLFTPTVEAIITGQLQYGEKSFKRLITIFFSWSYCSISKKYFCIEEESYLQGNKFQDISKIEKKQENKRRTQETT